MSSPEFQPIPDHQPDEQTCSQPSEAPAPSDENLPKPESRWILFVRESLVLSRLPPLADNDLDP